MPQTSAPRHLQPPKPRLLLAACLWCTGWLAIQAWMLYQATVGMLSSTLARQPWWRDWAQVKAMLVPLAWFLLPALGLYLVFAWINASAFRTLLLPHFPRRSKLWFAFLLQLGTVTFAVSLLDTWLYPQSQTADALWLMLNHPTGKWGALVLGTGVASYFAAWLLTSIRRLRRKWAMAGAAAIGISVLAHMLPGLIARTGDAQKPNVIVIGVDSLRPDHLHRFGAPFSIAPNVERILDRSVVFADALTPQAHTFPATVAILTGQYPVRNGARGNLFPPQFINTDHSMAWRFRNAGYRTVFGLDETRFANIDERYGFDEIVGPGIGVADFLMSFVSDTVLVNLVTNTPPGRWLFPHMYGNRAVDHVYRPESFSRKLDTILTSGDARPLFLYAHFCAAHWPYRADSPLQPDGVSALPTGDFIDTNPAYLRGVMQADAQVGHLLETLEKSGRLDNAILVLLSDHGEDFAMRKDDVQDEAGLSTKESKTAHGNSAIRAPQVQVVLGWRKYGRSTFRPQTSDTPVSLVDVAPTLIDLAALPADGKRSAYDGVSLRKSLTGGRQPELESRIRFVESSFVIRAFGAKSISASRVLDEQAENFEITPEGRAQIRQGDVMQQQLDVRERAAYRGRWAVALPRPEAYIRPAILVDRQQPHWQTLDAATGNETTQLLIALCEHWRGDVVIHDYCADTVNDAMHPALSGNPKRQARDSVKALAR